MKAPRGLRGAWVQARVFIKHELTTCNGWGLAWRTLRDRLQSGVLVAQSNSLIHSVAGLRQLERFRTMRCGESRHSRRPALHGLPDEKFDSLVRAGPSLNLFKVLVEILLPGVVIKLEHPPSTSTSKVELGEEEVLALCFRTVHSEEVRPQRRCGID